MWEEKQKRKRHEKTAKVKYCKDEKILHCDKDNMRRKANIVTPEKSESESEECDK